MCWPSHPTTYQPGVRRTGLHALQRRCVDPSARFHTCRLKALYHFAFLNCSHRFRSQYLQTAVPSACCHCSFVYKYLRLSLRQVLHCFEVQFLHRRGSVLQGLFFSAFCSQELRIPWFTMQKWSSKLIIEALIMDNNKIIVQLISSSYATRTLLCSLQPP